MCHSRKKNPRTWNCKLDRIDAVLLSFISNELRVRMSVVPEIHCIVDGDPSMIKLGKKSHTCRDLSSIDLLEYRVRDIVHLDFLERGPWCRRSILVVAGETLFSILACSSEDEGFHLRVR